VPSAGREADRAHRRPEEGHDHPHTKPQRAAAGKLWPGCAAPSWSTTVDVSWP